MSKQDYDEYNRMTEEIRAQEAVLRNLQDKRKTLYPGYLNYSNDLRNSRSEKRKDLAQRKRNWALQNISEGDYVKFSGCRDGIGVRCVESVRGPREIVGRTIRYPRYGRGTSDPSRCSPNGYIVSNDPGKLTAVWNSQKNQWDRVVDLLSDLD